MLKNILFVGLGSGVGGAIRYLLFVFIEQNGKQNVFPLKTIIVNVLGCFLLGLFYGLADNGQFRDHQMVLFLTMGLCGGFTTFSTFSNDNMILLKNGHFLQATLYVVSSILICLLATYLGHVTSALRERLF